MNYQGIKSVNKLRYLQNYMNDSKMKLNSYFITYEQ